MLVHCQTLPRDQLSEESWLHLLVVLHAMHDRLADLLNLALESEKMQNTLKNQN